MGLNMNSELSSWLESITYLRNIIAHHSRLWSRQMAKKPISNINNPKGAWFDKGLNAQQTQKPFLIISCMVYLCDHINKSHPIKRQIKHHIESSKSIPAYKLGFIDHWASTPLWTA